MTDWLKTSNFAKSTLSGGIAADALALTPAAVTPFPAGPAKFRGVLWGSSYRTPQDDTAREIVEVSYTDRTSTPWTIARAQEGTTAAAWDSGTNLALVMTAGVVDQLQTEIDGKSATTHNHNLNDLSEKAYASLTGKPTSKQSLWLPPGRAILPSSAAATYATVTGTNVTYETIIYPDGALRYAWWQFAAPAQYSGGNIDVSLYWLLGAGANTTINLNSVARTASNGVAVDAAGAATGIHGNITWNPDSEASGDLYIMSRTWSTALPSATGYTMLRIGRGSTDDLAEDAVLLGIKLEFPTTLVTA